MPIFYPELALTSSKAYRRQWIDRLKSCLWSREVYDWMHCLEFHVAWIVDRPALVKG